MELKVVINLKEGHAVVGVQQKDTDPVVEPLALTAGDSVDVLNEVLDAVPGIVARAQERWAASPKNPPYQGPPVPPSAPATPTPTSQPVRKEVHKEPKEGQMQRLI